MAGTLYIVATPIGNLQDITLRAISILSDVDIILAEDTRVTQKLLTFVNSNFQFSIFKSENPQPTTYTPQLISYHQHSSETKKLEILKLLMDGKNIALVTDAGTPGISDPGNELISFLLSNQWPTANSQRLSIVPIPGPSAITTALSVSGLNVNKFTFLGFWPKKKVTKLIKTIKLTKLPFVFYESPFRIIKTLTTLNTQMPKNTQVFIGRELTKMFETHYRGTFSEVIESLGKDKIKGEIVVVVDLKGPTLEAKSDYLY